MKALEFFQSLGLAEILITLALILICVVAWYDCKFIDNGNIVFNKISSHNLQNHEQGEKR